MNDVAVTIIVLGVALGWRFVTFRYGESIQPRLHKLRCLAWLPQWYTVLFAGVGYLLWRTMQDLYRWEVQRYSMLSPDKVSEELGKIPGMTQSERDRLAIHEWLRWGSLFAPVAGVIAAVLVASHACRLVWCEKGCAERRGSKLQWCMSYEVDLVLMVVAMPLVFALMAMRAEVRILEVMTGSAWLSRGDAGTWREVMAYKMSVYTAELQLACVFQYCTFWNIGALCVHYMQGLDKEYRSTLKWAGLQGIGLYLLVGAVVSLGDMLAPAFALNQEYGIAVKRGWEHTRPFIMPTLLASMFLCFYNVIVIGNLQVVKGRLPRLTSRMMATKALVMFTQFQLPVISAFTVGSWILTLVNPSMLSGYDFSKKMAALLHAVLLNFECLLVVCANWFLWNPTKGYAADDGTTNTPAPVQAGRTNGATSITKPLLKP